MQRWNLTENIYGKEIDKTITAKKEEGRKESEAKGTGRKANEDDRTHISTENNRNCFKVEAMQGFK